MDALTALLTRRVRADPNYRHLVVVWSTLRAGERDRWGSAAGYGLIPESTLRLAKAQLQELAFGRNDSRLTLLLLQMTRRISELEAKRVLDEQRVQAAQARLAAAQLGVPAAAAAARKPAYEPDRPQLPPSGFAPTQPMEFTRISTPAGPPAMVLMSLRDGDEPPQAKPATRRGGFALVELFDPDPFPSAADTEIVDFRDTETFERPPPDEQELLPEFELLPMN